MEPLQFWIQNCPNIISLSRYWPSNEEKRMHSIPSRRYMNNWETFLNCLFNIYYSFIFIWHKIVHFSHIIHIALQFENIEAFSLTQSIHSLPKDDVVRSSVRQSASAPWDWCGWKPSRCLWRLIKEKDLGEEGLLKFSCLLGLIFSAVLVRWYISHLIFFLHGVDSFFSLTAWRVSNSWTVFWLFPSSISSSKTPDLKSL